MPVIITVTNVVFEAQRVIVKWSDGTSSEFSSRAALADYAAGLDTKQLARQVAFAVWKAKGMADGSAVIGKGVNVDLSGATATITVG